MIASDWVLRIEETWQTAWQCKPPKGTLISSVAKGFNGVHMKYSLDAIPIEVLALALIEFIFVSTYAAVLWYVLSHK